MGKIKHELYTFGKAEVTASMGSAVDFGLAFMLSDIVGIYYGLANALGVMAGGVTNCCLNYRYVFGDSNRRCGMAIFYRMGHQLVTQFGRHHRTYRVYQQSRAPRYSLSHTQECGEHPRCPVGQLSCPAQVCIQACQTEVCRRKLRHRAFTSSEVKEVDQNIQNQ